MSRSYDAVVVGAGINGLVAAAELAGAGWSVALVDEHDRVGGFIDSDELTRPGYVHDTFSSWHPLFVAGGAYAALGADLHRHGLEYRNTDGVVTASVSELGTALAHRDPATTAAGFAEPQDADAYAAMLAGFEQRAPHVFGALGAELDPWQVGRLAAAAARKLRRAGVIELARDGVQSGRGYVRERFRGFEADQLWTPWLLHAGLSPDHASGGVMLPTMAFTMHAIGLPVVAGGARNFIDAFCALLLERGVDLVLGSPAERIEVEHGRATGVVVDGRRLVATRAVLTSSSTARLYRQLLPPEVVPPSGTQASARHRPGRAAMQVHLALSGAVPWADARLADVPLVHVSDGSGSTGIACAQAEAGLLPAEPTVVVGQQSVLDPGRAPAGGSTLWLQLQELPFAPRGDAANEIGCTGGWTPEVTNAYVERVLDRITAFAPGLRERVLGTHVINPADLTAANPNAVAGDPYGGACELDQNLVWRPGTSRGHRTGIDGLWHIGAFTHPGPGLGGGSGHLVASRLTTPPVHARLRRRLTTPSAERRPT